VDRCAGQRDQRGCPDDKCVCHAGHVRGRRCPARFSRPSLTSKTLPVSSAARLTRGNSSAGRALRSQCRGPGFDPPLLHSGHKRSPRQEKLPTPVRARWLRHLRAADPSQIGRRAPSGRGGASPKPNGTCSEGQVTAKAGDEGGRSQTPVRSRTSRGRHRRLMHPHRAFGGEAALRDGDWSERRDRAPSRAPGLARLPRRPRTSPRA
jgi:hypothetical protein